MVKIHTKINWFQLETKQCLNKCNRSKHLQQVGMLAHLWPQAGYDRLIVTITDYPVAPPFMAPSGHDKYNGYEIYYSDWKVLYSTIPLPLRPWMFIPCTATPRTSSISYYVCRWDLVWVYQNETLLHWVTNVLHHIKSDLNSLFSWIGWNLYKEKNTTCCWHISVPHIVGTRVLDLTALPSSHGWVTW